jgi:hypothetical protein
MFAFACGGPEDDPTAEVSAPVEDETELEASKFLVSCECDVYSLVFNGWEGPESGTWHTEWRIFEMQNPGTCNAVCWQFSMEAGRTRAGKTTGTRF